MNYRKDNYVYFLKNHSSYFTKNILDNKGIVILVNILFIISVLRYKSIPTIILTAVFATSFMIFGFLFIFFIFPLTINYFVYKKTSNTFSKIESYVKKSHFNKKIIIEEDKTSLKDKTNFISNTNKEFMQLTFNHADIFKTNGSLFIFPKKIPEENESIKIPEYLSVIRILKDKNESINNIHTIQTITNYQKFIENNDTIIEFKHLSYKTKVRLIIKDIC